MTASVLDLNRTTYLEIGGPTNKPYLDYLSAKYLNMRFQIAASKNYVVGQSDVANAPGIAFNFYGSVDYWWVVCMYNGILDPISEFAPGLVLQLPTLADVNAFLSAQGAPQASAVVTL